MKKIYKFYFNEQSYILKENEEDRFIIPRDTLEFNGNKFYQNLFKEYFRDASNNDRWYYKENKWGKSPIGLFSIPT